uniref:Citrate synthase n=1 Tax=Neorickettsia helminthoeca TaxID=33994 RepID=Q93FV9_9RICK|nr:citrate synthase [Neorickettsia helminthoeca]
MDTDEVTIKIQATVKSSGGPNGILISSEPRSFIYDPGYVSTASCKSEITFVDGEEGVLLYRGYPVDELATQCDFLRVVYLLLYGELPDPVRAKEFRTFIQNFPQLPDCVLENICSFPRDAHPMVILISAFAALASAHHDSDFETHKEVLIANVPRLVAYIYRYITSQDFIPPDACLSYVGNFFYMMFGEKKPDYESILDKILILHADHEQNASTSTARMVVSSGASPIAAVSAATATLWGPLHGGANEKVLHMLGEIEKQGGSVEEFIERVKRKEERLMGFGHRVYKNYDPRAVILKSTAQDILKGSSSILSIASKLESIASNDEYFISRKLYPNVDFYSGIILNALGIPTYMFTPIFALARTSGWVAQIKEFLSDKEQKIARPRQIYIGKPFRKVASQSEKL